MSTPDSRRAIAALPAWLLAIALSACGGNGGSATGPSGDLDGTWTGPASDSSGPGQMTWQLEQSGASVSGSLTMTDSTTGISGQGTVSGTLSGATLNFTLRVPAGGFGGSWASCTVDVTGSAQVGGSSMTGTYTGSNSCSGSIQAGQLTLTKS